MDQITNLYKNRAEALLEQVNFLENKLKNLQEQEKTEPKYGRGKKAGFGASGSVFGEEEIDYTGGNIDPKTGAWSASSGGAAIADTEAGDTEIKERMRKIAKGGGIFEKGVEKTEQTAAYKEMAGELERRRQAREAAKSGVKTVASTGDKGGTQKVPGTEAPSGRVAKQPMQIPDSGKIAVTPPTGPAGTGGPGDTSRAPARPQPMAQPTVATGKKQDDAGIDPKLIVLGLAGAAYGGKKVYDYYARQRDGVGKAQEPAKPGAKPQEPAKPIAKAQEPAKPGAKPQEPAKPGTVKAPEPTKPTTPEAQKPAVGTKVAEPAIADGSYSTKEGKIVTPKKTAPSVAERAALGRDLLRARMAQRTQEVAEPTYGQQKPASEAKPNVPETQVKPGDISTKGGQVVSKGSSVSSKAANLLAKSGKGLLHFGVQTG